MAFRSSAIASSASGGSLTATPSGVVSGDYLAGVLAVDFFSGSVTQPTSWNTPINFDQSGPDGQGFRFSDKVATGTDSFQWSAPASGTSVVNAAWSGRDAVTPRSTTPVTTNNTTSNTTPVSATITGITASASDDVAVFMVTDQTSGDGRWTFSTIAGYTEQQDGTATDWASGIALDTRDNVSSGATGSFASTITRASGTGNAGYGGIVVAIKAAAGAAATSSVPPQGYYSVPLALRL